MKRTLIVTLVAAMSAAGAIAARDAERGAGRQTAPRSATTHGFTDVNRPYTECPDLSGRTVMLLCPSDAVGCAGLGAYGGTPFLVTAPEGTRRATTTICTESGNSEYTVRATPGNVQCFPKSGDSRVVTYSCAGVRLIIF